MTDDFCKTHERFQEEETTTNNIKQFPSTSSINMIQQPSTFPIQNTKLLDETLDETDDNDDSFHLVIPSNNKHNNKLKEVRFSQQQQNPNSSSSSTTTFLDNNFSLSTTSTLLDSNSSNSNSSNSSSSCESTSVKSFHDIEDEDETLIKINTKSSSVNNNKNKNNNSNNNNNRLKENFLDDEDEDEDDGGEIHLDETRDGYVDDDEDNLGLSIKSSSSGGGVMMPSKSLDNHYSKAKPFLLDSPQYQSPCFNSKLKGNSNSNNNTNNGSSSPSTITNLTTFEQQQQTTPKRNFNKHLRNMSDISVYSNMYDDELDPSLIPKYFNDLNDDEDQLNEDDEFNERLFSCNNNNRMNNSNGFGGLNNGVGNHHSVSLYDEDEEDLDEDSFKLSAFLPNGFKSGSHSYGLDQDLSDDEFSSIFVKVNTNIKKQVNKIGGEETRPEEIPNVSNNDEDLTIIFGKRMKMPRRSSQSGKSNVGMVNFYGSREGRNRSISDVSTSLAQIPISQLTRSAITPSNDDENELLNWNSRNTSERHLRMRAESVKLMENLGIDNSSRITFDTPKKASESTLERHRIAFLTMYSSSHRAKFQEESSLVIQSLFRGYVERKKSTKGLVFMSYICTAAFGKVNRMRRERTVNSIATIQAILLGFKSRRQFHIEKSQHPLIDTNSEEENEYNVNNNNNNMIMMNQESDNVNNISLTNSTTSINSTCSIHSSDISQPSAPLNLPQHFNEEQVTQLQALCRGRIYKLSNQVRNFKINKRIQLLTKSHPLIRETYKCFMDIIVGKWSLSSRQNLTFLDEKTTNIIAGTHKLYPTLLENLYQLISCNTKNKYWVMRRSLFDLMSECNNPEFEEILEAFNQFSPSLKNKNLSETDAETAQMKLLIEFLLDQGNVLPKILMQLMLPEHIYRNSTDFFQSPFISNRNSKRTLTMLNNIDSFSVLAKQSYNEKSPMSSDSFASDFSFLCEELSKVFFENNFKSILFEKRLFQFHSTVCHLLDLLTARKELSEKQTMEIYKIVLQKLLPYLYSLISLDLAKIDSQPNIKPLWDYIQSTLQEPTISLTNSMKFITVSLPSETAHQSPSKRRKSLSRSLSKSQKTLKLEMSKEKFNLFASIGLANNSLDFLISQILQTFTKERILKSDSPLCSLPIQSSVMSAIRSLQLNGNFKNLIVKNE